MRNDSRDYEHRDAFIISRYRFRRGACRSDVAAFRSRESRGNVIAAEYETRAFRSARLSVCLSVCLSAKFRIENSFVAGSERIKRRGDRSILPEYIDSVRQRFPSYAIRAVVHMCARIRTSSSLHTHAHTHIYPAARVSMAKT